MNMSNGYSSRLILLNCLFLPLILGIVNGELSSNFHCSVNVKTISIEIQYWEFHIRVKDFPKQISKSVMQIQVTVTNRKKA